MKRIVFVIALVTCLAGATPSGGPEISIDVRDASILDVVSLLAQESGGNVVADASVRAERVTLRLVHVRVQEALALLAASHGLAVAERDGVFVLGAPDAIHREQVTDGSASAVVQLGHANAGDAAKALESLLPVGTIIVPDGRTNALFIAADPKVLQRARIFLGELDAPAIDRARNQTVAYRLRFTQAETVVKELKSLLPSGIFVADDGENAILVSGDEAAQESAAGAIANLDVAGPQVLFEVRVADLTPVNDSSDVGLEFGGTDLQGNEETGATTYAFTGGTAAINVRLSALMTTGHAEILATPRLVTLNGREADLLIGETYPVVYSTSVLGGSNVQFVDIGVKLRLTPIIGPDGSVTAELHPEYSELQGFTSSGYPIIANRKIDSTLRVRAT